MTRRIFSKLLKSAAIASSVVGASAMLSVPALAQSEPTAESPQEIELSADAFEILCERSPLNSRCEGGAAEARNPVVTEPIDSTDPADAVSDPAEAPVDRTPDDMSSPSYQMPSDNPGAVTSPMPDEGPEDGAVPKQASEAPVSSDVANPTEARPATPDTEPPAASTVESTAPAASISESELQQFAEAVPQIQAIERSTQQQVVQTVEESGFTRERFSQLYQQQTSGSAIEPAPSAEEEQTFTQTYSNIQKIQQDAQVEREQIIEAQGLEPQRFDQILAAVLQDPALQQQVQSMLAQ